MSQTVIVTSPGETPPGQAGPDGITVPRSRSARARVVAGLSYLRHALDGTPGQLRLISALCVLATVLAGLGGAAALYRRAAALDDARQDSRHLVLLQGIQTNLVKADADATNGFLAFGLVPLETQQDYTEAIRLASADLASAAQASPADAAAVATANQALSRYVTYVAAARDNNELPLGASYLQAAGLELRGTIIPLLEARSKADTSAISDAYSRAGNARWWLVLAAVVGLGMLLYAQVFLARRMRRIINVPAAAATAGLLVVLVVGALAMAGAQSKANAVRANALTDAIDISTSRVAAFDAKSRESLTLIVRGSGGANSANEKSWTTSMSTASGTLPAGLAEAAQHLRDYTTGHVAIRTLDDANNWNGAVKAATASGADSANAAFNAYDDATTEALTSRAESAADGLGDAGDLLTPAAILLLLVGLLAAGGGWLGISLRLDEYR